MVSTTPLLTNKRLLVLVLALGALVLAGCNNLDEQPKLSEPYDVSPLFGSAARELDPNAVAQGYADLDPHLTLGVVDGEFVDTFPFEVTREVIEEGQTQYNAFCTPCHGYSGYGDGIVVAEGMQQPESFFTAELREQPVGYFYNIMAEPEDVVHEVAPLLPEQRWALVAYIRALQMSQYANFEDLPPDIQAEFEALSQ